MDIFKKVKSNISNRTVEVAYGIKNLIKWFPIIWKDRQWDHYFIHVILKHKLSLMRNHFIKYNIHRNSLLDAKKMDLCVKLLNRIIAEDYYHKVDQGLESYEKAEDLIEQDLDLLYKTIRKNVRGWWD